MVSFRNFRWVLNCWLPQLKEFPCRLDCFMSLYNILSLKLSSKINCFCLQENCYPILMWINSSLQGFNIISLIGSHSLLIQKPYQLSNTFIILSISLLQDYGNHSRTYFSLRFLGISLFIAKQVYKSMTWILIFYIAELGMVLPLFHSLCCC